MREILVFLLMINGISANNNDEELREGISLRDFGPVGYYDPGWYARTTYYGPSQDPCPATCLDGYSGVTRNIELLSSKPNSRYLNQYPDPYWYQQWNLQDYRGPWDPLEVANVMDHNVVPVHWLGYTGVSVNIAVVGDSIDQSHPDLRGNIETRLCHGSVEAQELLSQPETRPLESVEPSEEESGDEPEPDQPSEVSKGLPEVLRAERYSGPPRWGQGTRAAGVIAMIPGNGHCGVGVAFGAQVAGVDTSGGLAPELELSKALTYEINEFDIYLNLWGPTDDGSAMDEIGYLVERALQMGIQVGRKKTGALYIVGSGDGKKRGRDNCGADALVNSVFTLAFASASQRGKVTPYSERCPAILATAYSSGAPGEEALLTTDPGGDCTAFFGGTGASASVAAGIIALLLQSNPRLSYRDVMHLIALTSEVAPLADNAGTWERNKAGFWVSNDFGFGLLDARNLVFLGWRWPGVGVGHSCTENKIFDTPLKLEPGSRAVVEYPTSGCGGDPDRRVTFIEQVELTTNIWYIYRGALRVSIRSPDEGLETVILEPRPMDSYMGGYEPRWTFKTVQNWGEHPSGHWRIAVTVVLRKNRFIRIYDHLYKLGSKPKKCGLFANGCFYGFSLTFHGLEETPDPSFYRLPRTYSSFRLADGRTSEDLV